MLKFTAAVTLAVLFASGMPDAGLAQAGWDVSLKNRQARALTKLAAKPRNTALAISPDGPWGVGHGYDTVEAARARAMRGCRAHLRKGRRDCLIYAVNGKVVAPAVVTTRRITALYRPLNGRSAAAFFGLVPVNFTGNPERALADYELLKADPAYRGNLRRSKALEAILTGRSLLHGKSPGFAIWLTGQGGEQHVSTNKSNLAMQFSTWLATEDGLLCMFDRIWLSTGKRAGTSCLIISRIAQGSVTAAWAFKPKSKRPLYVIAGDARYAAVR